MKRKLEDYRIKEENGEFIIQRKEVIIERLGFLKLKKLRKFFGDQFHQLEAIWVMKFFLITYLQKRLV